MSPSHYPRLITRAALILMVSMSAIVFHGRVYSWIADGTQRWLVPVSQVFTFTRNIVATITSRGDLVRHVQQLEEENRQLQGKIVNQDELQQRILFYRDTAKIREHVSGEPIGAHIFSYTRAGGVLQAILDRGSDDGVAVGDIISTSHQEFVGVIEQTAARHSVVRVMGDAALEVTARVLGTNISGLVRSESGGKVILELVRKDESLSEGATVMTSGDNRFPSGLIIGTVRSVDSDATTLFQIVRIAPAIDSGIHGPVLVIRP